MGGRNTNSVETTGTTATGNNESTNTSSQRGGRTGGRAGGRNTSAGKQNETIPKSILVDVPDGGDTSKEEKPKPQRGRPKGTTTRKTTTAATKKNAKPDTTQIKILLLTVSGIIASRPNMEVWAMTGDEIDQVVEPLANILAKHNVGEATSEYADYIALLLALFVIFVPKYLMWKQTQPKKEKKQNATIRTNTSNEGSKVTGSSTGDGGVTASNGTSFGEQLHGLIPTIGGI